MDSENLERYFAVFRGSIIGNDQTFTSPFGVQRILYADWTASGRAYAPIEEQILKEVLPFAANTHTGTTFTGTVISTAYEKAKTIIKQHVNADRRDVLIFCGSGMTAAVNKLQRILGLRIPERLNGYLKKGCKVELDEEVRPVIFVTHMEHHSNHTSWLETIADVEIINADKNGNVDLGHFQTLLNSYPHRKNKIAAVTACSNVTGIITPYHIIAKIIHEHEGLCFVDFACSAPYVDMNMHPNGIGQDLDAIYFSPHKFLGGPATPGVLIFNKRLYTNKIPDQPGGGTVSYSNPWGERHYTADIEEREDGGTPPFLQAVKAAMCIRLKEEMDVEKIRLREKELLQIIFSRFEKISNVRILEKGVTDRLAIVSFVVSGAHHNLVVKLLNDRFGIQTRGGCSCAGTYGHHLLSVSQQHSGEILNSILSGDMKNKPGWVRLSLHPTMSDTEINLIMDAIEATAENYEKWAMHYDYSPYTNEFLFKAVPANL